MSDQAIINAINTSPLNRGLSGADWLAHGGNVPIVMGDDIALFDDEGDCNYQVHFLFVSRGRKAIAAAKEAFRQMFEKYGADLIFGLVPNFRRDVKMLARWVGGKLVGVRETPEGPCELFVLSKEMWSTHVCPACQ
ncbi:MAG: hypothetical protein H0X34_07195 [Chthoniobacterales bacterium]|nr:hypothetical protein [Chthoniobacterales bacterium]